MTTAHVTGDDQQREEEGKKKKEKVAARLLRDHSHLLPNVNMV